MDSKDPSPSHLLRETTGSDVENSGLSACDSCYQRKIKCDRKSPCGNCQDSKLSCLRLRQKQKRKPRENVSSRLNETRQQMEARMASLESTITGLMGNKRSSVTTTDVQNATPPSASRATLPSETTKGTNLSEKRSHEDHPSSATSQPSPPSKNLWGSYSNDRSYSTPPFSAIEAQSMIQQELNHGTHSKQKRDAFHAALGSLTESLNTSYYNSNVVHTGPTANYLQKDVPNVPSYPSLEAVYWLLTPERACESLWAMPDSIPLINRATIAQMAIDIQDPQKRLENPAAVVCICSIVGHFLLERMMISSTGRMLDESIQDKITAYFLTAQRTLAEFSILAPPSLPQVQALIFGATNAQEAGNPMEAWKLNTAACNMCIALNLHKRTNAFSHAPIETLNQARCCFLVCYIIDKGLAMNLGKPPSIPDSHVEFDLRDCPITQSIPCRQAFQDYTLELAFVQSSIIELQLNQCKMPQERLHAKVADILHAMDKAYEIIDNILDLDTANLPKGDMEYEVLMSKFSFHTLKTVLFHSCFRSTSNPTYRESLLEAARASLDTIRTLHKMSSESEYQFNIYKAHSFAHWTVLYYPFTSFFVLFCNVISKKYFPDYELMLAFVEYLTTVKKTSGPVAKLHNLCLPFCALASTALKSTEDTRKDDSNVRNHKRQKITAPNKIPSPLGQPAVTNNMPPSQEQVTQIEQQLLPDQLIVPPAGDLNNGVAFELNDDILAQFMDFQPRLQWLDTDFSAFEQTWGNGGFGGGQDFTTYPGFPGNGYQ